MFELHPKTKKLLELFADAAYGTRFTYAEILQKTGCDLVKDDRGKLQTVLNRLERDYQRTLLNIRGKGYKVAEPGEFVGSMRIRHGRAKRQSQYALRTADAAPMALMAPAELKDLNDQRMFNSRIVQAFAAQAVVNQQQAAKTDEQEERLRSIEKRLNDLGLSEKIVVDAAVEDEGNAS